MEQLGRRRTLGCLVLTILMCLVLLQLLRHVSVQEYGSLALHLHPTKGHDNGVYVEPRASFGSGIYKAFLPKGEKYAMWLLGTEKPTETEGGSTSPWTESAQLNQWGWEEGRIDHSDNQALANRLQKGSSPVHLGDLSTGTNIMWTHKEQREIGGVTYHPTGAVYSQVFYPEAGVILTLSNYGPEFRIQDQSGKWQADWKLPKLSRWSDVVFLTWASLTAESPQQRTNLRWIQREVIQNAETIDVMESIVQKRSLKVNINEHCIKASMNPKECGFKVPEWPGVQVKEGTNDFNALLATPNMRGIVWLLVQHEEELGERIIKSIRIYDTAPVDKKGVKKYQPSLLVEIGARPKAAVGSSDG